MTLKINTDLGKGHGRWRLGSYEELIPLAPTVNIACDAGSRGSCAR
ncbi:LamB/YcsF family protein [Actinoallomurus iriomotensis]